MSTLLTRDGRIPKNKWLVLPYTGGRIISRHSHKSTAMDRALMVAYHTAKTHVVCEIKVSGAGQPFLSTAYTAKP